MPVVIVPGSDFSLLCCCDQITERAAFMSRLVDGLLRGRSPPFARHEAAAAMSEVRAFVRAWRPTTTDRTVGAQESEGTEDGGRQIATKRPSSDALLKLAQVRHVTLGTAHAFEYWRRQTRSRWNLTKGRYLALGRQVYI